MSFTIREMACVSLNIWPKLPESDENYHTLIFTVTYPTKTALMTAQHRQCQPSQQMAFRLSWLCRLWLLIFSLGAGSAYGDLLSFNVSGLNKPLAKNVALYLETLPEIEPVQLKGLRPDIEEAVRKGLMAIGYYSPSINMALDERYPHQLNIVVDSGPPVRVRSLKVDLNGDAHKDRAFKRLLKKQPLKEGGTMNDGQYESLKAQLNDLALARGYFDSQLSQHQVRVYPEQRAADIHLVLNAGNRYAFGDIRYGDVSPATRQLLAPLINFRKGDPFQSVKLSQLNRDFSSTGYFSQIDVRPLIGKATGNSAPIFIHVVPKTDWEVETGIGFSTDEGPRVSLSLERPWMNERGHSQSSDLKVSTKVVELSSRYKIPYGNPLLEYYSLELGYQKKTLEDTNSSLLSSSVHRWTKRPDSWDQDLFFRLDFEDFTQGLQKSNNRLLIPGVAFNRRRVRGNPMDPVSGSLYNVKLEASSKTWGSDADFLKLWGRGKWLATLAGKHRFLGRIEQGGIRINDINDIPPSIRFFTGGDQSVRGFSYESISPRDASGQLTGAQYMSAVSAEYNYEFTHNWRLAAFIDSGSATNDYKDHWKTGTGVGIRWVTPLGPLKLDLAFAISEEGSPWRIHFSMGPDL